MDVINNELGEKLAVPLREYNKTIRKEMKDHAKACQELKIDEAIVHRRNM